MKRRIASVLSAGVGLSLVLAACGGGEDDGNGDGNGNGDGTTAEYAYNAGNESVVNPSDQASDQTLVYGMTDEPDSTDPGDMYYAMMINFSRLYARPMFTFKSAPGNAGNEIVPDLAAGPGEYSKDLKTWTYKIKPGIKYEDGTTVKSSDVKYAIERSNYGLGPDGERILKNGPTYFSQYMQTDWKGPYEDEPLGLDKVETPDDETIIFHLDKPFSEFDALLTFPQSAPVPPAADQGKNGGINYKKHPMSTGPYKFDSYTPGEGFTLVQNDQWVGPEQDPNRRQLVKQIDVRFGISGDDIDNRIFNGDIDVDMAGTGVQTPAARQEILGPESDIKQYSDAAFSGFTWFVNINQKVAPFDNVHCRRAVQYAVDHTGYQTAYGGPEAGGDIATSIMPPNLPGWEEIDMYDFLKDPEGNVDKAKDELKQCGHPDGFSTKIAYRSDRGKEKDVVESMQQALKRVGITFDDIESYPASTYTNTEAGSPDFVHSHGLGLTTYGWAADWPTALGFFKSIVDSRSILSAGNSNISEIENPKVDGLLDDIAGEPDEAKRTAIATKVDELVMEEASLLPGVYAKSLIYRNPDLTNVYVHPSWGMYDYAMIGKQ